MALTLALFAVLCVLGTSMVSACDMAGGMMKCTQIASAMDGSDMCTKMRNTKTCYDNLKEECKGTAMESAVDMAAAALGPTLKQCGAGGGASVSVDQSGSQAGGAGVCSPMYFVKCDVQSDKPPCDKVPGIEKCFNEVLATTKCQGGLSDVVKAKIDERKKECNGAGSIASSTALVLATIAMVTAFFRF